MIDYNHQAEILKALAHPIRLQIVDAIKDGEVCVKSLEEMTGASQSCVSQHLTILRNLGIVTALRDGNLVCYRLNHHLSERILQCIYEENTSETVH